MLYKVQMLYGAVHCATFSTQKKEIALLYYAAQDTATIRCRILCATFSTPCINVSCHAKQRKVPLLQYAVHHVRLFTMPATKPRKFATFSTRGCRVSMLQHVQYHVHFDNLYQYARSRQHQYQQQQVKNN